ncbi:DUF1439 domain-containing protein [Ramlibacter albus]|uniref:DUF1439 domain-containing protein n=1 Tax=Ramlibacter albus TaxID=2079448 RepID=A0A923MBY5_9BURK|nr:DUF1439 domain-containing protein [Ramlibacter albus]MBC5767982.1 DUF1439 domain-containing protein [Ramlibacter albus]
MLRRSLLAALFAPAVLPAQEAPRPSLRVSAAQIYKALSARFPVRWGVPGVVELSADAPQLLLAPARQQIGATLQLNASGPQMPEPQTGEVDLLFALRYEPSDRTLRAYRPDFHDVRWSRMPERTSQAVRRLLREMARQAVGEFVVHRFTDRELALADTMGVQPQTITVVDDGLLVQFGPKAAS